MLRHTGRSVWWRRDCTKPARRAGLCVEGWRQGKLAFCFLALVALARLASAASLTLCCASEYYADVGVAYGTDFSVTASGGTAPYSFAITSGSLPSGEGLSSSGSVASVVGTPGTVGVYTITITVTDSQRSTASVTLTQDVVPDVSLVTTSVPAGSVGVPYSAALQAAGGYPSGSSSFSYTWSSGSLPPGLSLNTSTGLISGTPTSPGSFPFSVSVTDIFANYLGTSASGSFTITITPPLTITGPKSLAAGTANVSYPSVTFTATGGIGGYSWSATGLPSGLGFSTAGVLSGTPTTANTYNPTFTVQDSSGATKSVTLALTINPPPLNITGPSSLPAGMVNASYPSVTFTATGGTGGYSWSATGLPSGLGFSTTGVLSGTPTTANTYNPTFTVRDSSGTTKSVTLGLTINPPSLTITGPSSLPAGTVNVSYSSVTFTATGGTGGYSWSATGLPSGLSFSTAGVLSGTPTATGNYRPTFAVQDSSGTTKSIALALAISFPAITISPTSLPTATEGVAYAAVNFVAVGGSGTGYAWTVSGQPSGLGINPSTGVFKGTPAPGTSAGSPYTVNVGVTDSNSNSNSIQIPLTVIPPPATGITLSNNSLSFTYIQGGTVPVAQSFGVLGTGGPEKYTVTANSSGNWLAASPASGQTPSNVAVSLQNLTNLSAGTTGMTYPGSVLVQPQGAGAPQSVSVTLTVVPQTPQLSLSSTDLRLSVITGSGPASGAIEVINTGGGSPSYSASLGTASWLSLTCGSQGKVSAGSPGIICLQLNPAGLQAGTYTNTLAVLAAGQEFDANITLQVNASATSIILSATAMTFTAIAGATSAFPATQTSAVLNGGSATMNWTAQVDSSTPAPWLLPPSPASGSSLPFGATQPAITFTPNPAGLAAGDYYAVVNVAVPDGSASNSPAQITILLKVLPAGSPLPAAASTSGMIFTAPVGGQPTAVQTFTLNNASGAPVNFSCLLNTALGASGQQIAAWLGPTGPPAAGTVPGSGAFPMSVQVNPAGLAAGTYYSELRLGFSNGTQENVELTLLVTPAASVAASASLAEAASVPGAALPQATSTCSQYGLSFVQPIPFPSGSATAGLPYTLQVKSLCVPQPQPNALNVTINFAKDAFVPGDQKTANYNSSSGYYESSWTPDPRSAASTVVFYAQSNPTNASGLPVGAAATSTSNFSAAVATPDPAGSAIPQGVFNAAFGSTLTLNAVAGGSFISIYGQQVASAPIQAASVPFPSILGGIKVTLAGTPLPLYYADSGQVNAIIPFLGDQYLNTPQSLVVYKNCPPAGTGCIGASPLDMNLLAIQPGIFPYPASGEPPQQGAIENANAAYNVADPSHPATAGETIVIYGSGLGQVSNPPPVGAVAPAGSLTVSQPTVYIGGIQAQVTYSGLSPGSVDLYQVNAVVPAGIPSGTINVYLSMPDPTGHVISSNTVTIN